MSLIMAIGDHQPNPFEVGPELQGEIDQLDESLPAPSDQGELVDGFVSVYHKLPEYSFHKVLGGDVTVSYRDAETPWTFRPIAVHASGLVVRDLTEPKSPQIYPKFYVLLASSYVPEVDVNQLGMDKVAKIIGQVAARGQMIAATFTVDGESMRMAYTPGFCKDAMLVHARAYSLDEIRSADFKLKSAFDAVPGKLITVQPTPNQPLQLFVEDQVCATPVVQNAHWRVGNSSHAILSYLDRDT
jgi:hypothetical protein